MNGRVLTCRLHTDTHFNVYYMAFHFFAGHRGFSDAGSGSLFTTQGLQKLLTWTLFLCLVFLNTIATRGVVAAHAHHWIPKKHEMNHNVRVGPPHIFRKQAFSQKLRFEVVYDGSIQKLNEAKYKLIREKLIPQAVEYFHNTLSVRPSKVALKLQRTCKNNAYFLKDSSGTKTGDVQFCKSDCVETKCGPVTVPADHLDQCRVCDAEGVRCFTVPGNKWTSGIGVDACDFILYVSSIQTAHCDSANAVAYASYCQQEQVLDRPIAGFANICPDRLDTDGRHFSNLLATVKHEVYHALGFSAGLFAFYRNGDGVPYTQRRQHGLPAYNEKYGLYQWSEKVVQRVERSRWEVKQGVISHQVNMVVTPRVKSAVRRHFGCPTLEGAEIENQGGVGTEFTHWEKRVFENEAMTGTYTQNPVFSRITLALMEDTGWYKANYSMADELDWGRNQGCLFTKASCKTWMESRMRNKMSADPFCFTIKKAPLHMRCTHSRLSVALCNLRKYDRSLPEEYQYFNHLLARDTESRPRHTGARRDTIVRDTMSYGGAVALADYCPFYQKFTLTGTDASKRETTCTIAANAPADEDNYALEDYSTGSKCIEQGRPWRAKKELLTRTMLDWGSGCYKFQCNGGLQIEVSNRMYYCQHKGQHLEVSGTLNKWLINGSLVCPSCEEFCGHDKGCPQEVDSLSEGIKFAVGGSQGKNSANKHGTEVLTGLLSVSVCRTLINFVLVVVFTGTYQVLYYDLIL